VVRRILIPIRATADLFGLAEFLVTEALAKLNAVLAITQASATHTPLAPLVTCVVAEWQRFDDPALRRAPIPEVQAIVARVFKVSVCDLTSERRARDIVRPRHVAMYLAKHFTTNSLPAIARAFGGRHHTSAVHAVKKMAPIAAAVASKLPPEATLEEWAQALRREMG
jgi:chromosomal replication initiation ATPase DnaA